MAFQSSLHIVEKCNISPPSGSVSPVTIPITILDLFWLPMPPIQQLFFFEGHSSKSHFTNTILPNIKHSLSLALQHFFPLAGNLTWPQDSFRPEIHCKDGDSVSFTVAESDHAFDMLIRNNANVDVSAFLPLVPQLIKSPAEKLFPMSSFQVTLFPDTGISIGITFNHAVADATAINHFFKTWACICQSIQVSGSSKVLLEPPCISRSLVKEEPSYRTELVFTNYLKRTNFTRDTFYNSTSSNHVDLAGASKVLATFVMGRTDINRLKHWVLAIKKENVPPLHLSAFVVVCAYFWVCLIKAQYGESVAVGSEEDQMVYFAFTVDCRARLEPPLPATYFGNCLKANNIVGARVSELIGDQGIPSAAELIGNMIREIEDGNAIVKHEQWFLSYCTLPPRLLTVARSLKIDTYDANFGWGKLKKYQILSIASTGAISLSECQSEVGAVEVSFVRDKVEMEVFTSLYTSTMQCVPPCNMEILRSLL